MVSAAITGTTRGAQANGDNLSAGSTKNIKAGNFGAVMAKSMGNNAAKNTVNRTSGDSIQSVQASGEKNPAVSGEKKDVVSTEDIESKNDIDRLEDGKTDGKTESKVNEAAENVAEKIEEKLGVTEEELQEALEVLGLTMIDLLQPGNITKVVMQLTGTQDAVSLLTNSDLKDILDFAAQQLDQLSQELNLPEAELDAVIERISQPAEETQVTDSADEAVSDVKTDRLNQTDTAQQETLEDVIAQKVTLNHQSEGGQDTNHMAGGQQEKNRGEISSEGVNANVQAGNVVQQLGETFETVFMANSESLNPADIVRQIVDTVRMTNTQLLQSIEIQLNPENLGKVNLLVTAREGVITAQITAENEQVKRAIESQVATLKESFESQGIKVDAVEVTVQSHGYEANQNFAQQESQQRENTRTRRRIRPEELSALNGEETEEETGSDILRTSENSSVEYTA